jgi:hypothetical protein
VILRSCRRICDQRGWNRRQQAGGNASGRKGDKFPTIEKHIAFPQLFAAGNRTALKTLNSDQFPLNGIHDRFQAIVSSQFLVDVVEVVAESLWADA